MTVGERTAVPGPGAPEGTEDDLRRSIGRGVLWAAIGNIVMRVAGIAVTAVVARILSPDEFGVFAIALAVFVVVTSLAELGMASAVARSPMEPEEIAGTVASISILVSFGLASMMALFAGPLASLLGMPDAAGPLRVMSICLALTGLFAVPGAQLVRDFRQDRILLGTLAGFVPANAVLIVLALMGQGAMAFAWSRVIGQIVTGLVFVACLDRRYRPEWRRELVGPLMRFGLPLAMANLINWTLLNADYLVLGRLLAAEQVGVYLIAFNVANWSTAVLGSVLNGVVLPALGRVGDDVERLVDSLVSATRLVALVALPIAACSVAMAPSLVHTLFGATWDGAAPVLSVLAVYGACFAFTLLYVNLLVAIGATTQLLLVQVAWVVRAGPGHDLGHRGRWPRRRRVGPRRGRAPGVPARLPLGDALTSRSAACCAGPGPGPTGTGSRSRRRRRLAVRPLDRVARDRAPHRRHRGRGRLPRRGSIDDRGGPAGGRPGAQAGAAGSSYASSRSTPVTPLRIGFVLEGLALGGCPLNALDLARTLRAQGHHVVVMAIDEQVQVSFLPQAERAGFDVVRLPADAGLFRRAGHLRRLAREHDLDVLHAFAAWLGRSTVLACGLRGRRVPVVLNWLMDNEFTTTARTPLVVGTGGLHREAVAVHGPRSYLLEPPVDLDHDRPDDALGRRFRSELGLGDDELVLVAVGRIDELTPEQQANHGVAKLPGLLLAMDALVARGAPPARLVLVGDGSGMSQVRERAAEVNRLLGREAVLLTGALADPRPAYAAADIGLAMGGSALRVMAHGRALVVLGDHGFSLGFTPDDRRAVPRRRLLRHRRPRRPGGPLPGPDRRARRPRRAPATRGLGARLRAWAPRPGGGREQARGHLS